VPDVHKIEREKSRMLSLRCACPCVFLVPPTEHSFSLFLAMSSNSPHSFSTPTKRNSQNSNQLPLPSGLSATPQRQPPRQPTSPVSAGFVVPPIPHAPPPAPFSSSTHAGGIQPSVSFFRPSRPTYYSRPGSPSSGHGDVPLVRIDADERPHTADSSVQNHDQQQMLKMMKQSREPLLPGPGPAPQSPSTSNAPLSPARSATRLVRTSLDRMFGINRGMSFDKYDERKQSLHQPRPTTSTSSSSSSPRPSFIPTPPDVSPPLRAIPVIDSATGKPLRRWKKHPSRNRFFLNGRLLTGGDTPWAFIGSFSLVLVVSGVWFGTTAVWWWNNESPAVAAVGAYLSLVVISTMLATATIDPGILPRNLDPDPPYPATSPSDGGIRAPMPRDLKVRTDVVRVKYCPTCQTYRPPRSSHCKMCDNCVDGCDHHCQWVNNCIGRRNYTTFFALLLSAVSKPTSYLELIADSRSALDNNYNTNNRHRRSSPLLCYSSTVLPSFWTVLPRCSKYQSGYRKRRGVQPLNCGLLARRRAVELPHEVAVFQYYHN